jgi:hypothetical protein
MDKNGKISCCAEHFDENLEKYVLDYFADLNINFKQWLQFAYMDRDNDDIEEVIYGDFYEPSYVENDLEENSENYKNKLLKISKELSDFYLKYYKDLNDD